MPEASKASIFRIYNHTVRLETKTQRKVLPFFNGGKQIPFQMRKLLIVAVLQCVFENVLAAYNKYHCTLQYNGFEMHTRFLIKRICVLYRQFLKEDICKVHLRIQDVHKNVYS